MFINHSTKEVTAKIVYYGPGLSGKTTNLQYIFSVTNPKTRGELVSIETEIERTLFFDLLPINVGLVNGYQTKFQLYTVPGQIFYDSTRKLVLKGADGIVFVVDSQELREQASIESFENLKTHLSSYNLDINQMPLVFQFNKRDLNNLTSVERLVKLFHVKNVPYYEAVALNGNGVIETLKEISKLTIQKVIQLIRQPDEDSVKTDKINFDTNGRQKIIKKDELPLKKIAIENMDHLNENMFESNESASLNEDIQIKMAPRKEYDTLFEMDEDPFQSIGTPPSDETDNIFTLGEEEIIQDHRAVKTPSNGKDYDTLIEDVAIPIRPMPEEEPEDILTLGQSEALQKDILTEDLPFSEFSEEENAIDVDLDDPGNTIVLNTPIIPFDQEPPPFEETIKAGETPKLEDIAEEDDQPFFRDIINRDSPDLSSDMFKTQQAPPLEDILKKETASPTLKDTKKEPVIVPKEPDLPFSIPEMDIEELLDIKNTSEPDVPLDKPIVPVPEIIPVIPGDLTIQFTPPKIKEENPSLEEAKISEMFNSLIDHSRITVIKDILLKNQNLTIEIKDEDTNVLEKINIKVDPQVNKITLILDVKK